MGLAQHRRDRLRRQGSALALAVATLSAGAARAQDVDLSGLSIEELVDLQVTSVSRRPQSVADAPASVFVITNEDVRRAGKVSLPEALRLAPNLHIAQLGAGGYGISAQGFNHSTGTANKLQVLIDGRSVYTPLYSGVFWDVQDILLEDLDRIEVLSGPAGTTWGSNAVNGVINITTRDAAATQGWMARATGGGRDRQAALRYGGKLGAAGAYRVYLMGSDFGSSRQVVGAQVSDSRTIAQGGFRYDWQGDGARLTLQGDAYDGQGQAVAGAAARPSVDGGNIGGRWEKTFADGAVLAMQASYDQSGRTVATGIKDRQHIYSFDVQHRFAAGERHDMVVGADYRLSRDRFAGAFRTSFLDPARRTLKLGSLFAQDEIALSPAVHLIAGVRAEHNSYTGLEVMPSLRLRWTLSPQAMVWAAASRAVRTPSRFDVDLQNPGLIAGGPDFGSEDLIAYQVGYRGTPTPGTVLSASAFYNVYDDLRTAESRGPGAFPLEIRNGMEGVTYGVEAWGSYSMAEWWRLSAGASLLHKDLKLKPGSRDIFGVGFAGNDPKRQIFLKSQMNLGQTVEIDMNARAIGKLASPAVPDYVELETRLGWAVTRRLELSVAGFNLLEDSHVEFINGSVTPRAIRRGVDVTARFRY